MYVLILLVVMNLNSNDLACYLILEGTLRTKSGQWMISLLTLEIDNVPIGLIIGEF